MSRWQRLRGPTPVANWIGGFGGNVIRSIQRGTITIAGAATSNTATITSVSLAAAKINFLGCTALGNEPPTHAYARVTLTDATTVTATKNSGTGGSDDVVVSYEVVEYTSGVIKSIQRGTISAAAGSATATISSVNTTKTEVNYMGYTTAQAAAGDDSATRLPRLDLQNATTVRCQAVASDAIVGFQVVEYF